MAVKKVEKVSEPRTEAETVFAKVCCRWRLLQIRHAQEPAGWVIGDKIREQYATGTDLDRQHVRHWFYAHFGLDADEFLDLMIEYREARTAVAHHRVREMERFGAEAAMFTADLDAGLV